MVGSCSDFHIIEKNVLAFIIIVWITYVFIGMITLIIQGNRLAKRQDALLKEIQTERGELKNV